MDYLLLKRSIEKLGLVIFTLNDVVKLFDKDKNTVSHFLNYNVKRGKIYNLKKGYYSLEKIENKFLLSKLFNDTYISLNSALEYYQITTQRYNNLELISKKVLRDSIIDDIKVNIVNLKHYFGYYKVDLDGVDVFMVDREKLLIDCLLNLDRVYLSEVNELIRKSNLNLDRLKKYLKIINSSVLNKRVGYLLELNNIDLSLDINNKYDCFNYLVADDGIKNNKWRLIINEDVANG